MALFKSISHLFGKGDQKTEEKSEKVVESTSANNQDVQKTPVNEPVAANESAANTTGTQQNQEERYPFTLLVGKVDRKDNGDIEVQGNVRGQVLRDEKVFVISPDHTVTATVKVIENHSGITTHVAQNEVAILTLSDVENPDAVLGMSVVTNIPVQQTPDPSKPLENPYLLGVLGEFEGCNQIPEYFNLLMYLVIHSTYIVPINLQGEKEDHGDGRITLKQGATVGFHWLDFQNKPVMPVFTDVRAFNMWEEYLKSEVVNGAPEPNGESFVMSFFDLMGILKDMPDAGITINTRGPQALTLPSDLIKSIITSEGFKAEFGEEVSNNLLKPINE